MYTAVFFAPIGPFYYICAVCSDYRSKMEAAESEAGVKTHLNNVLSDEEIANLPSPITEKINAYIDKTFEEYLTSKALHETNKSQIGK